MGQPLLPQANSYVGVVLATVFKYYKLNKIEQDLGPHIAAPNRFTWTPGRLAIVLCLLYLFLPLRFPWSRPATPAVSIDQADVDYLQLLPASVLEQDARQAQRELELRQNITDRTNEVQDGVEVSAVLVYSNQPRSLAFQLEWLMAHAWIREVIVWADDQPVNITEDPRVKVFHAPGPMGDLAYFYACALATTSTCLLQDLFTFNPSLDLLYLKYNDQAHLLPSSRVTAATTSSELHILKHLHFHNSGTVDLHTGAAWLRSAMFSKELAGQFLNQIAASPVRLLSRKELALAPTWFSLWSNTYPDLVLMHLEWLDVEGPPPVEVWDRPGVKDVVGNTTALLYDTLALQDPAFIPFPFPIQLSPPPHDARAITHDRTALFLSSQSPFPNPSTLVVPRKEQVEGPSTPMGMDLFAGSSQKKNKRPLLISSAQYLTQSFDPNVDLLGGVQSFVEQIDRLKVGHEDVFPSLQQWEERFDWSRAVDGHGARTCWTTKKPPRVSDHFGLHFFGEPRKVSHVWLVGSPDLALAGAEKGWTVQVQRSQQENGGWETVEDAQVGSDQIEGEAEVVRVRIALKESMGDVAKLRFVSSEAKEVPLTVCDIEIG